MRNLAYKGFEINLFSIKKDSEEFDFQINNKFFEDFEQDIVKKGKLNVHLTVVKTDLTITMKFDILGTVNLTCDKSLDNFDETIEASKTIYFKYGDENEELDFNLFQITESVAVIETSSHIMEFILLEIPFRKIHPTLREREEDDNEELLLYQTDSDQNIEESNDHLWSDLEKLKNKFNK